MFATSCLFRCWLLFDVFVGVRGGVCVVYVDAYGRVFVNCVVAVILVAAIVLVSFAPLLCRVLVIHFTVGVTVTPRPPSLSLYIRSLECQQLNLFFIFLLVYREQADLFRRFWCDKLWACVG